MTNDIPKFEAFQKIPRLLRNVVITEKIDGTNAQVCVLEDRSGGRAGRTAGAAVKTRIPIADLLQQWNACADAVTWAAPYGTDYERAWRECRRGDWMIWVLQHTDVSDSVLRHIACDCAEAALHIYERANPGDDRPRTAIAVARRFADRRATVGELAAARAAASAATWAAASTASLDAASAAARDVAAAIAAAGDAAIAAAGDAAIAAAWDAAWAASADIVRRRTAGLVLGRKVQR